MNLIKPPSIQTMIGWSAVEQFSKIGIQFLVSIVLARILTPPDFGLYAILAVLVALANTLANAGLTDALIQRDVVTHEEESSLFFFTITFALIISLTVCIFAQEIAQFYKEPKLKNIIYVMAICVFIGSFSSIQTALFSKVLDFKTTALISALASTLSGSVAIVTAVSGWGVWSLVAQVLLLTVISTLLIWFKHPWRPIFVFNLHSVFPYIKFGGYLLISRLVNVLSVNLYTLVIGKFYSTQDVGIFNRASNFQNLLVNSMSGIVAKVAFPVFALMADDVLKLERGLNNALRGTVLLSVPISVILILQAEPVIMILFGNQWTDSIPVLQILGFEALIWPLHLINVNLLMSIGRGDLMFKGVVVKFIITFSMLLLAVPYGILTMAIAYVVSSYFNLLVNIYYTNQIIEYGFLKQIKVVSPCLGAGIAMALVILIAHQLLHLNLITQLIFNLLIGGIVYVSTCLFFGVIDVKNIKKYYPF